jgi:hypothetical protein
MSPHPNNLRTWNSSRNPRLSALIYDTGHCCVVVRLRAQTMCGFPSSASGIHPHRRFCCRPLFLQESHFHAARFAN